MTVKDVWETEGLVTTAGAPELSDHIPQTDALAVGRLKAAGAIVFGKSNTPLYAGDFQTFNDVYGVTSNPWDRTRTAGGSSGGAAAAVAAGLTPLELGSDIGGSIRNPAHFNGVYGLKPSWGVVPSRGHIPGPPGNLVETDINASGPLARSLEDLRTALGIIAGPVPQDAAAWRLELDAGPAIGDVTELRVATVFAEGSDLLPVARDVRARLEAFAGRVGAAGARVDAVPLPVPLADGLRSWQDLVLPIIGAGLPDDAFAAFAELEAVPGDDPMVNAGRALASRYRSWARANSVRQDQRAAWAALFRQYDIVLAPVMPTTAFPHDTVRPITDRVLDVDGVAVPHLVAMAWCGAIGSVLLPVVTLPAGPTPDGLPVGHPGDRAVPVRPAPAGDRGTPGGRGRYRLRQAAADIGMTGAVTAGQETGRRYRARARRDVRGTGAGRRPGRPAGPAGDQLTGGPGPRPGAARRRGPDRRLRRRGGHGGLGPG